MKYLTLIFLVLLTSPPAFATPTVSSVTAQQRYPWNGKVDITYTVTGAFDSPVSLSVTATDNAHGTTYTAVASALSGDTGTAAGAHHIVWDLNAQGLEILSDDVVFAVTYTAPYCVIDLSAGANASSYPVTYLAEPPSGGFNTDEYKTTKLVLKRIEAGSFQMGGSVAVTLTKPFYCGLFEVTQKQYLLVTSGFSGGDKRPVGHVSYDDIRGSSLGAQWPASNAVDPDSFLGKLRTRTGLDFDLPTEAQWEYACRAGTTTIYSYGDTTDGNYMWYRDNASSVSREVGTKQPNPWGLYDMHGNVWEWCLDWYGTLSGGTDPKGSSVVGCRVRRGGGYYDDASGCTSSYRSCDYIPSLEYFYYGFRLVRTLSD